MSDGKRESVSRTDGGKTWRRRNSRGEVDLVFG